MQYCPWRFRENQTECLVFCVFIYVPFPLIPMTNDEAARAEKAAKEASDAVKKSLTPKTPQQPLAPMPSTDEGKDKKVDKGDWAML